MIVVVGGYMKEHVRGISFLIGVVFIILCGGLAHITTERYIYDSLDYYTASKSFVLSGKFALNNYSNTYRGYFFPLLLYFYTTIGEGIGIPHWISILVGNAFFASFIFTVCLPNMLPDNWVLKNNLFWRLMPLILFVIFWQDLIFYPLTDIYSFGMILSIINLSFKMDTKQDIMIRGFIIGIMLYCAYNIRTIYMFSAILYVIILFFDCLKHRIGAGRLVLLYCAILVGIGLSAYPQLKINMNQHNRKTIAVITDDLNGGELFTSQLYMGMLYDRYETYVGPEDIYPSAPMNFIDRSGVQIISDEKIEGFDDISEYIMVVLRHPIDYLGVIVRHAMSIMYMPWNHVYIYNLNEGKLFYALFNYIILSLFAIYVYQYIRHQGIKKLVNRNVIYVSIILIPCAAILFGAVEMRFFMPIYSFIYLIICMGNHTEMVTYMKENHLKVIIAMIFVFCILVGFWGGIMGSAQNLPQLLM